MRNRSIVNAAVFGKPFAKNVWQILPNCSGVWFDREIYAVCSQQFTVVSWYMDGIVFSSPRVGKNVDGINYMTLCAQESSHQRSLLSVSHCLSKAGLKAYCVIFREIGEGEKRQLLNYDVIIIYAQLLQTQVKEQDMHLKSICSNKWIVWTEMVFV